MSSSKRKAAGRRWAMVRRLALDRDGWRCQNPGCGKAGRLEVDHVRPLQHGGELFDLGNLANSWAKTVGFQADH